MSDTTPKVDSDRYDKYTEACPRMTRRWRRGVIPEITAWLLIHRVRVQRQKLHVDQACQAGQGEELRAVGAKLAVRLSVIDELIRALPDKWNEYLWWDCAKDAEDVVAPIPVKPVHTPSIPGMEPQQSPAPTVSDASTRRGDKGSDRPAVARVDRVGKRGVRPGGTGRAVPATRRQPGGEG